MRQKKRVIGLLAICLLTVGIVSVYAQGGNPLDEVWSTITAIMSRIDALETKVSVLEAECPSGIGPTYTIRTSSKTIDRFGMIEIWSYVTNPSLTIEREYTGNSTHPAWGDPLHNVEVQWINITIADGNGDLRYNCSECGLLFWTGKSNPVCPECGSTDTQCISWAIFYPDGSVGDAGGIYDFGWDWRWDATVHPGETTLVFYSGWGSAPDSEGMAPGIHYYIYELCVEFEGTTYNLVNTFELNVVEP